MKIKLLFLSAFLFACSAPVFATSLNVIMSSGTQTENGVLSILNNLGIGKINPQATLDVNGFINSNSSVNASGFFGVGAALTALNASNITSGTLNDSRLSSNVALLNSAQSITGSKTFTSSVTVANANGLLVSGGSVTANAFFGDGSSLSNLPPGMVNTVSFASETFKGSVTVTSSITTSSSMTASAFYGDGSNLSNLPAGESNTYASSKTFTNAVALTTYTEHVALLGNIGVPKTVDWSLGSVSSMTLTSSTTISFSNTSNGQSMTLFITQGGSGSYVVTWPTVRWPASVAPVLSLTVNKTDILTFFYDGTSYYGFIGGIGY